MRRFVAFAAALTLLSSVAFAQVAGQHRGIALGTANSGAQMSALGEVDVNNNTTMYPTGSGPNPQGWGNFWGFAPSPLNQGFITYQLRGPTSALNYEFVLFDTVLPGTVQTFWTSLLTASTFPQNVTDITLNSDADVVGMDSALDQVVKLDLANGTWTGTTINGGAPFPVNIGLGGVAYDPLSGNIYFANSRAVTTLTPATNIQNLYMMASDFSGLTTVASTTNTMISANMGGDILQDGTWISSSFVGSQYDFVAAGASTWTGGPTGTGTTTDVTRERFSAPGTGYYAGIVTVQGSQLLHNIAYLDAATTPHTVTTLYAPAVFPNSVAGWMMEAHALYNNDLCTQRTGKWTWDINVRPDPVNSQFAGKGYVVVASLTTPNRANPISLPNSLRELFLAPDNLTGLTAQGTAGPFIQNNLGVLDVFGNGTGKIDLNLIKGNRLAVNGNVIHFAGVILDPNAPDGIAWVLEPWAFVVNILP